MTHFSYFLLQVNRASFLKLQNPGELIRIYENSRKDKKTQINDNFNKPQSKEVQSNYYSLLPSFDSTGYDLNSEWLPLAQDPCLRWGDSTEYASILSQPP